MYFNDNQQNMSTILEVIYFMLCGFSMVIIPRNFIFFRTYRLAAYRHFTLWAHGKLGRHRRVVIPSCVVNYIRQVYPEASGIYIGFNSYTE